MSKAQPKPSGATDPAATESRQSSQTSTPPAPKSTASFPPPRPKDPGQTSPAAARLTSSNTPARQNANVCSRAEPEPAQTPPVVYHYTNAPESAFKNGLNADSSVTNNPYYSPTEAVEQLGLKQTPDKVIPIKNNGQFVPNKPATVQPHPKGPGGGKDFTNPKQVPKEDIGPAMPIKKD